MGWPLFIGTVSVRKKNLHGVHPHFLRIIQFSMLPAQSIRNPSATCVAPNAAPFRGVLAWSTVLPDASGWMGCQRRLGPHGLMYFRQQNSQLVADADMPTLGIFLLDTKVIYKSIDIIWNFMLKTYDAAIWCRRIPITWAIKAQNLVIWSTFEINLGQQCWQYVNIYIYILHVQMVERERGGDIWDMIWVYLTDFNVLNDLNIFEYIIMKYNEYNEMNMMNI